MELSPDSIIYFEIMGFEVSATLFFTAVVSLILVIGSLLLTRNLSAGTEISRWQSILESIVATIRSEIEQLTQESADPYLPFIGTMFLFVLFSNLIGIIPRFESPTGSLSTTAALALIVFFAVPFFAIRRKGLRAYLQNFIQPTPIMLPFNLISEISRTLALAVRLFGNMMSGRLLIAIMLSIIPLFVPVALQMLNLLIGVIQAYIFAVLAMVYIATAARE
jgi:F-type H+-transporting ATPase subunit a